MPRPLIESLPGRTNARLIVFEHEAELLELNTHTELLAFARRHGVNDARDFAQFKQSLRARGIDYDAMRDQAQIDRFYARQSHNRPHL